MIFFKKILFGSLIALCIGATMTSCGDDDDNEDDNEENRTTVGAPYTGIYQATYLSTNDSDDGSVESGYISTTSFNMHLTLETDNMGKNTCKYYSHRTDEPDSYPYYYEDGTWVYNGTQKTLTISFPGYEKKVFSVKSWTNNKLVTYDEEDGYFYEFTWTKVSSVITIK